MRAEDGREASIFQVEKVKPTAKGVARTYKYWYVRRAEGDRARNVYLGSVEKLTEEAAMAKAKKMKTAAIGFDL